MGTPGSALSACSIASTCISTVPAASAGLPTLSTNEPPSPSMRKLRSRSPSSGVASPSTPKIERAMSAARALDTSGGRASRTSSLTPRHDTGVCVIDRRGPSRRESVRADRRLGLELLLLGRALEGECRAGAAGDRLQHLVEVAGADLALVACGGVALVLELELPLLESHVRGHCLLAVAAGKLEHRQVDGVEAGERDELEAVAECGEIPLERLDLSVAQVLAPVERR